MSLNPSIFQGIDPTRARRSDPASRLRELERLSDMLEAGDARTHGHSQRVMGHVETMARTMRLPTADVTRCQIAAAVHDIGKIFTPTAILNKTGRLTKAEFAIIMQHPVDGAEMLDEIDDPLITAMVRHHHERIDGTGYPAGLRGDAIPLGARIIAVADTFDAMTSLRAYRAAGTERRALTTLQRVAGRQLDTRVVAAFLRSYGRAPKPPPTGRILGSQPQHVVVPIAAAPATH
jgi:putative two-component system response regulator